MNSPGHQTVYLETETYQEAANPSGAFLVNLHALGEGAAVQSAALGSGWAEDSRQRQGGRNRSFGEAWIPVPRVVKGEGRVRLAHACLGLGISRPEVGNHGAFPQLSHTSRETSAQPRPLSPPSFRAGARTPRPSTRPSRRPLGSGRLAIGACELGSRPRLLRHCQDGAARGGRRGWS